MSTDKVNIQIDSSFDAKGFKAAESATTKLNRTIKNLAGTLGIAYGTQAVVAFGKTAVKEFVDSQKAALQLSNTVNNLGLSFANADIDKFINNLSLSSGVIDNQLFPAMQKLLQVTGSVKMSQDLLRQSLDFSKGSNTDLATVVSDITNAYVGNNRGLKKYALGLSAAELKTASFDKVLAAFQKNFTGALQANLSTTAGKFDLLSNSVRIATENIGGGLVDAFTNLSGGGSVSEATNLIITFSKAVAAMERGAGSAIGVLPTMLEKIKAAGKSFFYGFAGKQFLQNIPTAPVDKAAISEKEKARLAAKAEADAEKRRKELYAQTLKNQKALTAEQKKQAALKKDAGIFDMQQIELVAALKGKLSDEDRKRVQLQLDLINGNVTAADALTKQILMAQDATGNLYKYFQSIGDEKIKNPFAFLDTWILDFQTKLNALKTPDLSVASSIVYPANINTGSNNYGGLSGAGQSGGGGAPTDNVIPMVIPQTNVSAIPNINTGQGNYGGLGGAGQSGGGGATVVVQIDGKTIATALQGQSLSGTPSSVDRRSGMFGSQYS